jgi:UPF0755 protein
MTRRRSPFRVVFFLLLVGTICIGSLIILSAPFIIKQRAAQVFGPPNSQLSTIDQLYLSTLLVINEPDLTTPNNIFGTDQAFTVSIGESVNSVSQRLYAEGLIPATNTFLTYLVYRGLDTTIQAGEYTLNQAMTAVDISQELQDATPTHVTFRILPGWRLEEIATTLPTSGLNITPDEFLSAANNPIDGYPFSPNLPLQASLEGFFYPDTYQLSREITVDEFIHTILDNFEINLGPGILQGLNRQGLNVFEGVILASIVEKESVDTREMPLIASVFYNRLDAAMKLDSDPTVQYALGYNHDVGTWWKNPLSLEDLKIESPYNTYLYPGLPPGPISNPSLEAINAVAFPAQSPYYYFRAACDEKGGHVFAETFEEHIQNACQ